MAAVGILGTVRAPVAVGQVAFQLRQEPRVLRAGGVALVVARVDVRDARAWSGEGDGGAGGAELGEVVAQVPGEGGAGRPAPTVLLRRRLAIRPHRKGRIAAM